MSAIDRTVNSLAGTVVATDFDGWSEALVREFDSNHLNGSVGQRLVSESPRVRVWEIRLLPGERVPAHRHVLDYFWTALSAGTSTQHTADGTTRTVTYQVGDTKHLTFATDKFLLHDLENSGDTELHFVTVEFLDSANIPLAVAGAS